MPRLRLFPLFPSLRSIVSMKPVQLTNITTSLYLFTFLFRCTFAAGLEKAAHYIPTSEQAHKSILEGYRDYHIDRYRSAILPWNKARHNKEAHFFQHQINKEDPNLVHHKHVITYKDRKIQSVEKREGFLKAKDPSILTTTKQISSIYHPHENSNSGLRDTQPDQKVIHVRANPSTHTPESAEKAVEKVRGQKKTKSRQA